MHRNWERALLKRNSIKPTKWQETGRSSDPIIWRAAESLSIRCRLVLFVDANPRSLHPSRALWIPAPRHIVQSPKLVLYHHPILSPVLCLSVRNWNHTCYALISTQLNELLALLHNQNHPSSKWNKKKTLKIWWVRPYVPDTYVRYSY